RRGFHAARLRARRTRLGERRAGRAQACARGGRRLVSQVSQVFSQVRLSHEDASCRTAHARNHATKPFVASCRTLTRSAVTLPCRRSWVRVPSSASGKDLQRGVSTLLRSRRDWSEGC